MSIYRPKKSPSWHYDFVIKGLRFHGSTGTASKDAARQVEARMRVGVAEGRLQTKRLPTTINAAAERFFEEVAKHQPSHATTEYQLFNLVTRLGKNTSLSEITDNVIAEYVARRRSEVSDSSVNREVQLLRRVLRRAGRIWKADVGETPNWRELVLPEPAARVRELMADEEARLFAHLREDLHPLVTFCLTTGVRLMNGIRLTWAQVDEAAGSITFRVKSRRPGGDVHTLPLTRAVVVLLAEQRGNHPIYVFTYRCKRSCGQRRKGEVYPFSQGGWRRDWSRAIEAAGIDNFRFHDLRHTAATRVLRASGNLKVVQAMLGHSDIATTSRYAHVVTDDVRGAMEAAASRNSPKTAAVESATSLKRKA